LGVDAAGQLLAQKQEMLKKTKDMPRKSDGVQAAMTKRNLEPDQWRNGEECLLVSGRRRQLL
jgi:hypothetical protein